MQLLRLGKWNPKGYSFSEPASGEEKGIFVGLYERHTLKLDELGNVQFGIKIHNSSRRAPFSRETIVAEIGPGREPGSKMAIKWAHYEDLLILRNRPSQDYLRVLEKLQISNAYADGPPIEYTNELYIGTDSEEARVSLDNGSEIRPRELYKLALQWVRITEPR